nr:helix-hairpin-helix domain-containing protein [Marinicella sp. W31]MDC2875845.1 helix-hairpin-helix domain-containing protein [Marinicella sp. W31]
MVGQVLASEGFAAIEELAYVELEEIASIEGFDEETAEEIQMRAKEFLERQEAELDEKRRELGVSDDLRQIDGMTLAMMVKLGQDDIKTMEDFAGCAADDLVGWTERQNGQTKRFEGSLSGFDLSRVEAENMVVQARLAVGWIKEEDLIVAEDVNEDEEGVLEDGVAEEEAGEDAVPASEDDTDKSA